MNLCISTTSSNLTCPFTLLFPPTQLSSVSTSVQNALFKAMARTVGAFSISIVCRGLGTLLVLLPPRFSARSPRQTGLERVRSNGEENTGRQRGATRRRDGEARRKERDEATKGRDQFAPTSFLCNLVFAPNCFHRQNYRPQRIHPTATIVPGKSTIRVLCGDWFDFVARKTHDCFDLIG